jgi:hypothetical protein
LTAAALGTKPSGASITKLADLLTSAIVGKEKMGAQQQKLAPAYLIALRLGLGAGAHVRGGHRGPRHGRSRAVQNLYFDCSCGALREGRASKHQQAEDRCDYKYRNFTL